jgi:hypothetical protein
LCRTRYGGRCNIPKTKKGKKIMAGFKKEYGSKKGERVAYATAAKRGGKLFREIHGRSKSKRKR